MMPLYDIKCDECGKIEEIFRSIKEFDELPSCCGNKMHRVLSAPMVADDIKPYISQINGQVINSRSQHRKHLREHNCIEIGNETHHLKARPTEPPKGLKEQLIKAVYQHERK